MDEDSTRLFAMVIRELPRSSGARRWKGYRERLTRAARAQVSQQPLFSEGELALQVVWFHRVRVAQDIDNVLKRIADSLEGVVYQSDSQVARCSAERVDLRRSYELRTSGMNQSALDDLVTLTHDESVPHILFVAVRRLGERVIELGSSEESTQ